jgi:hypothetical protein
MWIFAWLFSGFFKFLIKLALLCVAALFFYHYFNKDANKVAYLDGSSVTVATPAGWCSGENSFTSFYWKLAEEIKNKTPKTAIIYPFACSLGDKDIEHDMMDPGRAIVVQPSEASVEYGCAGMDPHEVAIEGLAQRPIYCQLRSGEHPSGYAYVIYYPATDNKSVVYTIDSDIFIAHQDAIFGLMKSARYNP